MNLNEFNTMDFNPVESKALATNFGDIAGDCYGLEGAEPKTEIIDRFPLVAWLLGTRMSQMVRARNLNGMLGTHKDTDGDWVMEIPRLIWTELPEDTQGECCWQPFDFAKCGHTVPLNLLCLKDCDAIFDQLVGQTLRYDGQSAFPPIANNGEDMNTVKERVARMSMAFLTAYNVMLGTDNAATAVLKPFHGILEIMENPAVMAIYGGTILSAFDSLGCRLNVLGADGDFIFAVHPLIYAAIKEQIKPDQYNNLPANWTRDANGDVKFMNIGFIEDKFVPVDLENGKGEVWLLDGNSVGLFLATDLMPAEDFIRYSGHKQSDDADCGSSCKYYYNFGAVFSNNANKLAVITDIPVSTACTDSVADLGGLIVPQTLIPAGPAPVVTP